MQRLTPEEFHALTVGEFETPQLPKPGLYLHWKNRQLYRLHSLARHSETEEWLCIYSPCYGDGRLWVRPAAMWVERVAWDSRPVLHPITKEALSLPGGTARTGPRFVRIGD